MKRTAWSGDRWLASNLVGGSRNSLESEAVGGAIHGRGRARVDARLERAPLLGVPRRRAINRRQPPLGRPLAQLWRAPPAGAVAATADTVVTAATAPDRGGGACAPWRRASKPRHELRRLPTSSSAPRLAPRLRCSTAGASLDSCRAAAATARRARRRRRRPRGRTGTQDRVRAVGSPLLPVTFAGAPPAAAAASARPSTSQSPPARRTQRGARVTRAGGRPPVEQRLQADGGGGAAAAPRHRRVARTRVAVAGEAARPSGAGGRCGRRAARRRRRQWPRAVGGGDTDAAAAAAVEQGHDDRF